jgi:hypothetical protein
VLDEWKRAEALEIGLQIGSLLGLHVQNTIMSAENGQAVIPDNSDDSLTSGTKYMPESGFHQTHPLG